MAWFILSEDEGTPAHHERAEKSLILSGSRRIWANMYHNEYEASLKEFNPT